tara:strand:+ start:134 stop:1288 length:1155 start_codon:yes stop_codon:yes gene_type:complete
MTKARENSDYTGLAADLAGLQTNITAGDTAARAGRKNLIINGGMQVAQRATTYTLNAGASAYRTVDRWKQDWSLTGQMTVEQSTDAPAGFTHSLKSTVVAVSTDNFTSNSEYFIHQQHIEGFTAAALQYGTASAKPLTASFWVKANTPATYSAGFRATMNSAIWGNHQAFTINVANTWEKKTLTFNPSTAYQLANVGTSSSSGAFMISLANSANLGQTTNLGSWVVGNLIGLDSTTNMDNLSTKAVGQFVAFTGVQLELGSVATDFEHRSYGEILADCQRYFRTMGVGMSGIVQSTNKVLFSYQTERMRSTPSVTIITTGSLYISDDYAQDFNYSSGFSLAETVLTPIGGRIKVQGLNSLTHGEFMAIHGQSNPDDMFHLDAEL